MTATLTEVCQALADTLATIDGLNTYAFWAGTIVEPAAVVVPASGPFIDYRVDLSGSVDMQLVIGLFVNGAPPQTGAERLNAFLADAGASSVYAAVRADPTLGGVVSDAAVQLAQDYGTRDYAGTPYLGCDLAVQVML